MNLMDALTKESEPTKSHSLCKLGKILETVPDDVKEVLLAAVNSSDWSADELAFQMKKTQHPVGSTVIKMHRRERCGCYL